MLYVPEFKINLIFKQKLYKARLIKHFIVKSIYFKNKNDTPIIKYFRKNNIYFFKLITKNNHVYKIFFIFILI